jgi:mRNA interferase MazF
MASPDEVWIVDFGDPYPSEPAHRRPALVLGPSASFGAAMPFVIVCPITTAMRGLSLHVEVEPTTGNGLRETSYVQCELIRSLNVQRLVERVGVIDLATSGQVREVVRTLTNL